MSTKRWRLALVTLVLSSGFALDSLAQPKVTIAPSFETAGVLLEYSGSPTATAIKYRKVGTSAWTAAHPAVRYDARHAATSLFSLDPGCNYELGVDSAVYPFTTRAPFVLPAPTKVVAIAAGDSAGLRAALAAATAGVEIRIPAGNYSGGFAISASGTAAQPIVVSGVLSAADQGRPVEKRTELPVLTNSSGPGFVFSSASYVVLQNVRVSLASGYGVHFNSAHDCVLQNSQVYDNNDGTNDTSWRFNVILTGGGASGGHNMIQYNHVADTDNLPFDHGNPADGGAGVTYFGIGNIQNSGPGIIIRGNRIERHYDCMKPCPDESDSLDPGENTSDALGSHQSGGLNLEVYDNVLDFCRDDGIESDGFCVNARIFRNRITHTNNGISIAPSLPGPFFWLRNRVSDFKEGAIKINTNVGAGSAIIRNHFFYHNTFVKMQSGYLMALGGAQTASKLLTYRNNIFVSTEGLIDDWGGFIPEPAMDGDLWYSATSSSFHYAGKAYTGFGAFQAGSGQEAHGIWGDPKLDPSSLALASTSPAVDRAVSIPGINHLYGGNGPDVGAHEVGGTNPPPPPPTDAGVRDQGKPGPAPTRDGGGPGPSPAPGVDAAAPGPGPVPGQDASQSLPAGDSSAGRVGNQPGSFVGGCAVGGTADHRANPLLTVAALLASLALLLRRTGRAS